MDERTQFLYLLLQTYLFQTFSIQYCTQNRPSSETRKTYKKFHNPYKRKVFVQHKVNGIKWSHRERGLKKIQTTNY